MKKLMVLLLSSGAFAALGLLAVDIAPAVAAKCRCHRGPRGFNGPRGPRGARGPAGVRGPAGARGSQGPAGPAGPAGSTGPAGLAALNNWDGVISTPGQVQSLTIGSFTVSDADALDGSGCQVINLTNNSSAQTADYDLAFNTPANTSQFANPVNPAGIKPGTTEPVQQGGAGPPAFTPMVEPGSFNNLFEATLEDGSSMIAGMVGNDNGTVSANNNLPCINVGGVEGM